MATIIENKKNGKTISFRFVVCLGRDVQGRQKRHSVTWTPPAGLSSARARKAAEREADAWEKKLRAEGQEGSIAAQTGQNHGLLPEVRGDDFVTFVNDIWFDLYICNGDRKRTTTAYYEDIAKYITAYFKEPDASRRRSEDGKETGRCPHTGAGSRLFPEAFQVPVRVSVHTSAFAHRRNSSWGMRRA